MAEPEQIGSRSEQLAILQQGVQHWNRWREENPEVQVNLEGEKLPHAVLVEANLQDVNFKRAILSGADLRKAKFQKAKLMGVDLEDADLREADLQETDLTNVNLRGADLRKANLRKARLPGAGLQGADLRGCGLQETTFQDADLLDAKLRDAILQNANLEKAKGFRSGQLGGANLTGATLPAAVAKFEALANVEELSKSAKKLFISILGACVYSWLTIATTTDVQLITDSASSPLPIIQTLVPIRYFYIAAPLLLVCLYLYFHFYMQRLWEGLAELPAFFPDGAPLDKKAHPWLLNGLVRSHFALLKEDRPALSRLQVGLASLLAWWTVPLTLFLFWWRYLFRHDLPITVFQVALLVFSIGAAIFLSRLAARTLGGAERSPFIWKKAYKDARTYKTAAVGVGLAIAFAIFWRVSREVVYGTYDPYCPERFAYFRADLVAADVSTKPEGWTGRKEDEAIQIALVTGARLSGRNLRGAFAFRTFLVKADLSFANLQGADLLLANLQEANLELANLQEATLGYANLQGALLAGANLQGAHLVLANLQGADLRGASGLDFIQVILVQTAANWESAVYSDELLKELGLPPDHNEKVFKQFPEIYNPDGARKPR